MPRQYDVVVYGATGFTGSLVAEYLARHYYHGNLNWAIAGRNKQKLEKLREELSREIQEESLAKNLHIIVADAKDQNALNELAKSTKVVLSTAVARYGEGVVKACAENGTSYTDITGESPFVSEMIEKYGSLAEKNKCRIVSFCGFDSIPSDLGAFLVATTMKHEHGVPVDRIDHYILKMKGGVSGGTLASMLNLFDRPQEEMKKLAKTLGNPYELMPVETRPKFRQPAVNVPWYSSEIGRIVYPFVMASVNSKVVHRSNGLLKLSYGKNFKFCEQMTARLGFFGGLASIGMTAGTSLFALAAYFESTRNFLRSRVPQPGDGPSKEEQVNGKLESIMIGKGEPKNDGSVPIVKVHIATTTDPGYSATSRMIAESAICLAKDESKLPEPERYGFLTPAAAMGKVLIDRLGSHAGVTIRVLKQSDSQL